MTIAFSVKIPYTSVAIFQLQTVLHSIYAKFI